MESNQQKIEQATFGGGCFWCQEAVYRDLIGVTAVVSGYAGGTKAEANYRAVCSGDTGHAEVVRIDYDPSLITYSDLLEVFWHIHDPTTPNRQGNDVGPQYRSVIFYHNEAQKAIAEESIREVAPTLWEGSIVTQLEPLDIFYKAEEYHQDYFIKVGARNPYCTIVISPKVNKFRKKFAGKLK